MNIGDRIKNLRNYKKISTIKLSELTGISQSTLSKLENGKRSPDLILIKKIAEALNVPLGFLTEGPRTFGEELYDSFIKSKIKIEDVAENIGLPPEIIYKIIKSEDGPTVYDYIKLGKWLGHSEPESIEIYNNNRPANNTVKEDVGVYLTPDEINTSEISRIDNLIVIPILGLIRAGEPILAQQNIIGYEYLPQNMSKGGTFFGLLVKGDSMNNARINDGDIILVREQPEVENGDIAVVLVDGENATVKTFYKTGTTVTLIPQSSNPAHKPKVIDITKETVKVLGKVEKVIITL